MATLTQSQLQMVALASGLPGDPRVWAAVAMAESSGNTTAKNPSSGAYGLWQIHPIHRKDHPTWTERWLSDPVNNGRAAAKIHASQGWGAWEAYTNGSYKDYLKGSPGTVPVDWWDPDKLPIPGIPHIPDELGLPDWLTPDLGDIPGMPGGDSSLGDAAQNIGAIAEAVQKAGTWMSQPKNWARIAYVWGGGFMVLIGVYIVASPLIASAATKSPVGQAARKLTAAAKRPPAKATQGKAAGTRKGNGSE